MTFGYSGRVREHLRGEITNPVVRDLDRLVRLCLGFEDTEGRHRAIARVDPDVRDKAGKVFEQRHKALVDERSNFCRVRDAFVASYCGVHARLPWLVVRVGLEIRSP